MAFDWWLYRWRTRWRLWKNLDRMINDRTTVENKLREVAAGKRPPLTADECKALADTLGMGYARNESRGQADKGR